MRLLPLVGSLLIALAAAPLAYLVSVQAGDLHRYGLFAYPLIGLVQALASATVFLPVPGAALAAAAGTFLDPLWVGVFAGLGSATGELTGYLLGYYGRQTVPVDHSRVWRLSQRGFRRWGWLALVVQAAVPNPVFDGVGILAGCLRYPVRRYWLATAVGKILKLSAFAYGGWAITTWMRAW